jgi:DNA-binding transcriptional LysR family regulator
MGDLDDMALFAAVVRAGSFTAAASELGITKQAVSRRVAGLEASLGVSLLARSSRSMKLTEAGAQLLPACEEIVARASEARAAVHRSQHDLGGWLRVTAPEVLGHELLMPVVAELARSHPALRFELLMTNRVVDLIEEGFDVALRLGEPAKGAGARLLGRARGLYLASPRYVEARGEPRSLRDLGRHACIVSTAGERWSLGGRSVAVEPALVVNTHEAVHRAVLAGLGIARLPEALASADLEAGRLRALFGGRPAIAGPVHAVWRTEPYVPRRVAALVRLLVEHAEAWPPLSR